MSAAAGPAMARVPDRLGRGRWVACARCRRRFGGGEALRRAHTRHGCLPAAELRARGLHRDEDGIWRQSGPQRLGQLVLRLWGPGRPHRGVPHFSVPLLGGSTIRVEVVSRRPWRVRLVEGA